LRLKVERFGFEVDAIGLDELRKNVLVAAFLPTVLADGFAPFGIEQAVSIGGHAEPRLAFGLHRDVPDGQTGQAFQR